MDNPAYFTVAWRADDADWDFTDAGLFGSFRAARDEAAKRQANTDVPDLMFAPAVISMLDQDPVSGTPMSHLNPPNATGYAMASLSVPDSARRSLDHTLHEDFETVLGMAEGVRSHNRRRGNDTVVDVVAVTVIDQAAPLSASG
ncbi:hypothetical protein [Paenarthrobacter sp. YJN-5]|uniref:hypothetical protein n=1 Tax=Paenarthrobacter sp. YJN-5 TaxID=2735316 RepID=UPI001877A7A8|nr:hypothetical protein [Paenarthrobacter sp. YJN-5]QOT19560.1 hypothetical protein HMI59_23325 [Paenarthrobacter sp. YJN-5]